jgi:glycosyltransferase involved in cell wall biosynthesis
MGAPAARTFEHARRWVEQGHEVTVLCGKPNHPDGIVPEKYRGTLLYREKIEGINVLRCWLYTTPNRGVFKRSFCFMSFMLSSMFFGSFFSPKCDIVIATSPQMLCGFAGYFVSLLKRRPYVLEVRDLWPKQIIDLAAVKNNLIIAILTWVEMFMYRRAKGVITVAPATKDEIASRGIPEEKLYTITNGIDEEFFVPKDRMSPAREKHNWGDDIIVLYIGTHGLSQGLATILDTAEMLQNRGDIRFVFAGTGADREPLIKQAKAMQLTNIEFLSMQHKNDMPDFYAASDICLVPLKKREVFLYNIPSKMFEIMACGRPILLGAKGQAKKLLQDADAGIPVEPEDAHAFGDAILELADDPERRKRFGENGREHVLEHYRRNANADRFITYLEEILSR